LSAKLKDLATSGKLLKVNMIFVALYIILCYEK